jgi:tRNA (guanine37-N1)-methyltransferase
MSDGGPLCTFEVVTLFPEMFAGFVGASLLGKAIAGGLVAVHFTNPRDFGKGRHRSVDDAPYGGGPGMIMAAPPLAAALQAIADARGPAHRVLLTPQGRVFDQTRAHGLAQKARIVLVCGRYEGVDDRVGQALCDEELSIGDYVLAGGELGAAVVIEAVARLLPGVLGCGLSVAEESFSAGRLEYPQWTRPEVWGDLAVPDVLLSGDHRAVARFRLREAARRTRDRRPDLLDRHPLTPEESEALSEEGAAAPATPGGRNRPGP